MKVEGRFLDYFQEAIWNVAVIDAGAARSCCRCYHCCCCCDEEYSMMNVAYRRSARVSLENDLRCLYRTDTGQLA